MVGKFGCSATLIDDVLRRLSRTEAIFHGRRAEVAFSFGRVEELCDELNADKHVSHSLRWTGLGSRRSGCAVAGSRPVRGTQTL